MIDSGFDRRESPSPAVDRFSPARTSPSRLGTINKP
jgi:hypothetical protein